MITKTEYLKLTPKREIDRLVSKAINECLKDITIPDLKEVARLSLFDFYYRQYREISRIKGLYLLVLLAAIKITDSSSEIVKNIPLSKAQSVIQQYGASVNSNFFDYFEDYDTAKQFGVSMQKFCKDYINDDVKPVFDRLIKQYPKDIDDVSGRNSLRNRAEMEVRYHGHIDNIDQLRQEGHKLVIASTHADCSDRCSYWQGKVYSLDGTSGTTPDGRGYQPLENATDIWYTTKAGKRYKNGLLGFNCRHYLVAYKDGYRFGKMNPQQERKEYEITKRQRELERDVRYWRTQAVTYKGTNRELYLKAYNNAIKSNKRYMDYSKANGRAYYPDRTKLI